MGYAVVSSCYQVQADAAAASSQLVGSQVVSCSATSPFYELTQQQKIDSFVEGHLLGWGVALAMVSTWVVSYLRRGV